MIRFSPLLLLLIVLCNSAYAQNTILWKVEDPIHQKTSFLLGTYHQMGNSFADSHPEIKRSLLSSELAIFESIGERSALIDLINARAASDDLDKHLKKKDLQLLKEISKDWKVDLYKLRPTEIQLKLIQECAKVHCGTIQPTDTWTHFDEYLTHTAEQAGISLMGLENDSMQLNFIEAEFNTDWKMHRKQIRYWLNEMTTDNPDPANCTLAKNYMSFNLDYAFNEVCPDDVLLKPRNKAWMEVLPEILLSKNCFVAVGYYHLIRECGLVHQLRENGFLVTPIRLDNK